MCSKKNHLEEQQIRGFAASSANMQYKFDLVHKLVNLSANLSREKQNASRAVHEVEKGACCKCLACSQRPTKFLYHLKACAVTMRCLRRPPYAACAIVAPAIEGALK